MSIPDSAKPRPITPYQAGFNLVGRDGLPSNPFSQHLEEMRSYTVGSGRIVPCSATGTNAIVLTPNTGGSPKIEYYVFGDVFVFWAAATSTGAVTVQVVVESGSLDALNAYSPSAAALGTGDIVDDRLYKAIYAPHFNSGNGGMAVSLF